MSSYSAKGGVLVKQFISERMSRDYAQELAVITEVLEAILADTGYPNIGCLMISRPKNGTLGQLLEAQIGEVDEDRHDVFLEHIKVHSELCGEIIGRLDRATCARDHPAHEGLQKGNPRALYLQINEEKCYIAYFGSYEQETSFEIGRVYLAIVKILKHLYPFDRHLEAVANGIIDNLLTVDQPKSRQSYNETLIFVDECFRELAPGSAISTWMNS